MQSWQPFLNNRNKDLLMTFTTKNVTLSIAIVLAAFTAGYAQSIPLDKQVRTGKLSNGFTYYIRHNEEPQKRVELYLINKVGSVLEDEDQQGLAHFMEHMNFNGTKHFPKNELIDYLQKAGVRFGADLNAYTSFDETVYQLPIPTDNASMFSKGLKIMRDWAQEATLDPKEINAERGVVLEEERLGKGANDRMKRQYLPVLLNHSRYADRLPIGKDEVLTNFKPDVIKRFHHDWYRPDLQALIIVGDVNVDDAERMVKEKFSDLKNPVQERKRTEYTMPLAGVSQFKVVTDKEETSTSLEVLFKHRTKKLKTEQDYLTSIKKSLFNEMLNNRKTADLAKENNPAFTGVSIGIGGLLGNVDMLSFSVSAKPARLQQSFEQAWTVFERVKKYGFSDVELNRAKQNYLRQLQSSLSEQGKTASVSYVKEYQSLFLNDEASPGIAWEYRFSKGQIPAITLADINNLMQEYLSSRDIDVIVSAPEKDKNTLPDSVAVQKWIHKINTTDIKPFQEDPINEHLLTNVPNTGKLISKKEIPALGITQLTFNNGVKVILKPTDFKNDQIIYGAFSPGGTSLYDGSDYDVAANAGGLISRMGLGKLNPVQLSEVMTGKVAASGANIGPRSSTIRASASSQDLESALQLTYLEFTAPRKDTTLFKTTMDGAIAGLANRYADPNQVFADTISYVQGNYNYRSAAPTAERLSKITLNRAYDIYKENFADASGFTFVFVGNFAPESITPLLVKYLGSLPSANKSVRARDLGIHIPAGKISKKVYKGTENKATVRMVLSGSYIYSPLANLELKALGDILQIKILQQLREAEGEVYSPQVQTAYNKLPQNRFAINIAFGCAPKNADHLISLVERELTRLREQGPEVEDILKFKASYEKNLELALKDNAFWLNYLLSQYENGESELEIQGTQNQLAKITVAALKQSAQVFLSGKNEIIFELLPESN
jgi:zinc protease